MQTALFYTDQGNPQNVSNRVRNHSNSLVTDKMAAVSPTRPTQFAVKATSRYVASERKKGQLRDDSVLSTDSSISDDPLRILQPAQKKVSNVESQRVLSVLDESIKRIEIVSALPYLVNSLDRHSVSLGADITALLTKYKGLTEEFSQIVVALGKDSYGDIRRMSSDLPQTASMTSISSEKSLGTTSRTKLEPIVSQISDEALDEKLALLTGKIKHNTKSILRAFSNNPAAFSVMRTISSEITYGAKSFKSSMGELRGVIQERLLTTKQEEETRSNHVDSMSKRERELQKDIGQLEEELNNAREQRDKEVSRTKCMHARHTNAHAHTQSLQWYSIC